LPQLQFGADPVRSDIADLACGPGGQLYALADLKRSGSNSVFRVDIASGLMTWVREFDVDRFMFTR
jgi:hypothetical protein